MTHALSILIASSVGWTAPEARPARMEIDLLVAVVETSLADAAEARSTEAAPTAAGAVPGATKHPSPKLIPSAAPAAADPRAIVTYDLALPWVRTKP